MPYFKTFEEIGFAQLAIVLVVVLKEPHQAVALLTTWVFVMSLALPL